MGLSSRPRNGAAGAEHTLGGLDSDDEVIGSINVGFVTEFIGGLLQESEDLLVAEELALLVGTTGDLGDSEEVLPAVLVSRELIHQILKIPIKTER